MRLFELFDNALPAVVYHATSEAAWGEIKASNSLHSGRRKGISFTTSMQVARDFARFAAGRDNCDKGVIIEINLNELRKKYEVIPYRDKHTTALWHIKDEKEMKVMTRVIPNISDYIIDITEVKQDSHDGIFENATDEILFEKVATRDLREQAFAAILSALRAEPDKRLEEIAHSLSIIANRYNSQWKSGIKNARGYELDKMHLMFEVTFSPKHGGSFSHSKIDYDGNEMRVARIIFNIVPYDELFKDKVPQKFAIDFSNSITDAFVHEMIHYTQSVKIKTSDSARISRIEDVQSVGTHKDEKMTDEKRKRYYKSINEIDAYAANAASELAVSIGVDAARAKMKNFSELAQYSPIIARYIKYAKDRPKAWKRFMSQVAFQLDQV